MVLILALSLLASGCGGTDGADDEAAVTPSADLQASTAAERGGTISVGEESWTIVPAIQCAVYPGNVVSIAGHAEEDSSIEIVIDYGGPNQVVVGSGMEAWHAGADTIVIEIDGKRVRGTATFTRFTAGTQESREGSFDLTC